MPVGPIRPGVFQHHPKLEGRIEAGSEIQVFDLFVFILQSAIPA
jgi:hypothetical protein